MKQLLPKYGPLTVSIGFIEAPLGSAVDFFLSWTRSQVREVTGQPVAGDLDNMLERLDPLTLPPTKDLLVETRSIWTAFFDNSTGGADAASPMSNAARELRCRSFAVKCLPNTLNGTYGRTRGSYGAVQFELFSPTRTEFLNCERSVAATNDGGKWTFVASGREQSFEEVSQYRNKKIADRFTPDMLERYGRALGVELFDPAFYGPNGYLIVKHGIVPQAQLSLNEAYSVLDR